MFDAPLNAMREPEEIAGRLAAVRRCFSASGKSA